MKTLLKPDASVLEAWRVLALQAKVLEGEIARAREESQARHDSRTRLDVLGQAQAAAGRTLRALVSLLP